MYIVYVNPIGAGRPEREEYQSRAVAEQVFAQACTPVLSIAAWLIYKGPNPVFQGQTMTTIEKLWHM